MWEKPRTDQGLAARLAEGEAGIWGLTSTDLTVCLGQVSRKRS